MRFFETTDYDDFAFIDGNRPIVDSNVKRFVQIIKDGELHDEIQVNPTKVKGKWVLLTANTASSHTKSSDFPSL